MTSAMMDRGRPVMSVFLLYGMALVTLSMAQQDNPTSSSPGSTDAIVMDKGHNLTWACQSQNAASLSFKLGGENLPTNTTVRLNTTTMEVRVANMTAGRTSISCYQSGSQLVKMQEVVVLDYGMKPSDPIVEVGTNLTLNCTLSHSLAAKFSAQDIIFMQGNKTYDKRFVTVVDRYTASLLIPNISPINMHAFCYVKAGDENELIPSGQQNVCAGRKPLKPNITKCVVDNWEKMTCYWEPTQEAQSNYTGLLTTQELHWTILDDIYTKPHWNKCHIQHANPCVWSTDTKNGLDNHLAFFRKRENYTIQVEAVNSMGRRISTKELAITLNIGRSSREYFLCPDRNPASSSCTWVKPDKKNPNNSFKYSLGYTVYVQANSCRGIEFSIFKKFSPSYLVRPKPVANFKVDHEKLFSTNLTLTWKPPIEIDEYHQLLFKISYKSDWSDEVYVVNVTNVTKATLVDLSPNTDYDINISVIPWIDSEAKGYWSTSEAIVVETKVDVPAGLPELYPGAFLGEPQGDNTWIIHLFWKPVPGREQHGDITNYQICLVSDDRQDKWEFKNVQNRTKFHLDQRISYNISLVARTVKGYNKSLTPVPITVPVYGQMPPKPQNFVVISLTQSIFNLTWLPVPDVDGYTLYWCKGSHTDMKCESDLNWMHVGPNITRLDYFDVRPLTRNVVIISISAEKLTGDGTTVSSGMQQSHCSYNEAKEVKRPQSFKKAEHQPGESISVQWKKPACSETGYIKFYRIYYCAKDKCDEYRPEPVDIASYLEAMHTISSLEANVEYEVWMTSVSASLQESRETKHIFIVAPQSGLSTEAIAGIFIGSVVLLTLVAVGIFAISKNLRQKWKNYWPVQISAPSFDDINFPPEDPVMNRNYTDTDLDELSDGVAQNYRNEKKDHVGNGYPSNPGFGHRETPFTNPDEDVFTDTEFIRSPTDQSLPDRVSDYSKVTMNANDPHYKTPKSEEFIVGFVQKEPTTSPEGLTGATVIDSAMLEKDGDDIEYSKVALTDDPPGKPSGDYVDHPPNSTLGKAAGQSDPNKKTTRVNTNNGNNNPSSRAQTGSNSSMSSDNSEQQQSPSYRKVTTHSPLAEVSRTSSDSNLPSCMVRGPEERPLSESGDIGQTRSSGGNVAHPPAVAQDLVSESPDTKSSLLTPRSPGNTQENVSVDPGGYVTEVPGSTTPAPSQAEQCSSLGLNSGPEDVEEETVPVQGNREPTGCKVSQGDVPMRTIPANMPSVEGDPTDCSAIEPTQFSGGYVPINAVTGSVQDPTRQNEAQETPPPLGYVTGPPSLSTHSHIPTGVPRAESSLPHGQPSTWPAEKSEPSGYVPLSTLSGGTPQDMESEPLVAHPNSQTSTPVVIPPSPEVAGGYVHSNATNSVPIKNSLVSTPPGGYVTEEELKKTLGSPADRGYVSHDTMENMGKSNGTGISSVPTSVEPSALPGDSEAHAAPQKNRASVSAGPGQGSTQSSDPAAVMLPNGYVSYDSPLLNTVPSTQVYS